MMIDDDFDADPILAAADRRRARDAEMPDAKLILSQITIRRDIPIRTRRHSIRHRAYR